MKYIGIIWNPTYMYQNEIKKDIKKIGKNIKLKSLNLDNKNFIEFILIFSMKFQEIFLFI